METILDHNPTADELEELGLDDSVGDISRLTPDDTITCIASLYDMRGNAEMFEKYKNMLSEEQQWQRFPPDDCLD